MLKISRVTLRILITSIVLIIFSYLRLYHNYTDIIKRISNNLFHDKQNNLTNCFSVLKENHLRSYSLLKRDLFNKYQLLQKLKFVNIDNFICKQHIFSSGDNLFNILTYYEVKNSDVISLIKDNPILGKIKIGQSVFWNVSKNGKLNNLSWIISYKEIRSYIRVNNHFKEQIINILDKFYDYLLNDKILFYIINNNIPNMNHYSTYQIIQMLKWKLVFNKFRKNNKVLILNLKKINQFFNIKTSLNKDENYHNLKSYKKYCKSTDSINFFHNFMRFPITKRFRISSGFNLHRLNPVTGRIMPHLGVDFAVPVGTQILAVGDGKVISIKRNKVAGNYLTIKHNEHYVTRYMHLKKILVKYGQNVRRGDLIALSGNSGRSTGPHLHYEIWVNKQAINPLKI